jgi:hypothetical protein
MVIFLWLSQDGHRGNRADMNLALTLIGIGINLAGIAIEVSPIHNIWLTLACVFMGGGFIFLGFFGNRQPVGGRPFLDRIDPVAVTGIFILGAIAGLIFLFVLCGAVYNLVNREMDIQAAKAGVSTPAATPTSQPDNR